MSEQTFRGMVEQWPHDKDEHVPHFRDTKWLMPWKKDLQFSPTCRRCAAEAMLERLRGLVREWRTEPTNLSHRNDADALAAVIGERK